MGSRAAVAGWFSLSLLAAAMAGVTPLAHTAAFEWRGGPVSQSGVPNPLSPPDTALMRDPTAAPRFDVSFTNRSIFSYRDSNLLFGSAVAVINDRQGEWISLDDHGLLRNAGVTVVPTFVNFGLFRKTGGGPTLIVNVDFRNFGVIRSEAGLIGLNSPTKTFNDGTVLAGIGAGRIEINNGGTFNGGFIAGNTEFRSGTYVGNDARLNTGRVDWTAGVFTGRWTNTDGTIVARETGGVRAWGENVVFTNDKVFRWESGDMTLGSNARVFNSGTYEAVAVAAGSPGVTAFNWTSGTVRPTVTNTGLFVYMPPPAGSSTLRIGDVNFVNFGTIRAASGPINFNGPATFEDGTKFEGAFTVSVSHDATFRGAFFVNGPSPLSLRSGAFTGADATMNGRVIWLGGTLAGKWTNNGTLFTSAPTASQTVVGNFINIGVFALDSPAGAIGVGDANTPATIENRGRIGVLTAFASSSVDFVANPATALRSRFVNTGDFDHRGPGTTRFDVSFTNQGNIAVQSGNLSFLSDLEQRGNIQLDNAFLLVPSPTVNFGRITGTGTIAGDIFNGLGGYIAPGLSPGTMSIVGSYTHGAGSVLEIELQNASIFDQLLIDGSADLQGGELALHCFLLCNLKVGDALDFLDVTGELTGAFGTLTLDGFGAGWLFDVLYDYDADRVGLRVLQVGGLPPGTVNEPGTALLALLALAALSATRRRGRAGRTTHCVP